MSANANPYAISRTEDQYGESTYPTRDRAYTEPEEQGPYAPFGAPFADRLAYRNDSTPDPLRLQKEEPEAYRQGATWPERFWRWLGGDRSARERVQTFIGTSPSQKGSEPGQKRFSDRPGVRAESELRVTAQLSPATGGLVSRPFTGRTPKRFNGVHMSMADHQRYDNVIFGMAPARRARTTYRLDAVPWGERVIDVQQTEDYVPENVLVQPDITYGNPARRSYRLG